LPEERWTGTVDPDHDRDQQHGRKRDWQHGQRADEISQALAEPIGAPIDEDDLVAELNELETELVDEVLDTLPAVPSKPIVAKPIISTTNGTKPKTKEEEELQELNELMGM